jgi:glycerophosphoryl diester phosphodiesterase
MKGLKKKGSERYMLIIGHRGACGCAPENTIASMKLAIEQQCDGIECDVQITKDEELIICHDFTVDRTTNGKGAIKDLTLQEIRELDAGSWYSDQFAGEKIPTLQEVLELLPKDLFLNLELKSQSMITGRLEEKVVELLEKNGRIENTVISSFDHQCINTVQQINSKIKTAILTSSYLLNPWDYIKHNDLFLYSFHPNKDYVSVEMIEELHNRGYKIYSYTVNEVEQAKEFKKIGVDGIFTNYPGRTREQL